METLQKHTIGEYVAQDFRTAALFSKYKIDFCCKGNNTLEEVCQAKGLNATQIENEINSIYRTLDKKIALFKTKNHEANLKSMFFHQHILFFTGKRNYKNPQ